MKTKTHDFPYYVSKITLFLKYIETFHILNSVFTNL